MPVPPPLPAAGPPLQHEGCPDTKKYLIVIGGPTASGKTALAIRLAKHFGTEILSADSRQFYREMGIGTAKPTEQELAEAPHHFINSLSIHEPYNVGDYEREAMACLERLFEKRDVAILSGGSGLFVKALCEGLDEFPDVPAPLREAVEALFLEKGLAALQEELRTLDPEYFETVDLQNPHRLIRAVSVCRAAGRPYSSFRSGRKAQRFFRPIFIELSWDRTTLYERIHERVAQMVQGGLLEEARALFPYRHLSALQTVGYQELFRYFEGASDWETALEDIRRNSRRYAKRQLTWTRRDGYWKHFHPDEWPLLLDYLSLAMAQGLRLEEEADESAPEWKRLGLWSAERALGFASYHLGRKGCSVSPGIGFEASTAFWLMHELGHRAEGLELLFSSHNHKIDGA
jgi:tRNA dimethylallyltransferase